MSSPKKKIYNNLMVIQNPTNINRANTSQYPYYQNVPNNLINSNPSLNDINFKNAHSENNLIYQNLQQRPNTNQQMRCQNNQGQYFVNPMSPYNNRFNENNIKKLRQEEYARQLKEQIIEKQKKRELEKLKDREEELKLEKKIKREIEEENRKAELEKQRELEQLNKNKKTNNENNINVINNNYICNTDPNVKIKQNPSSTAQNFNNNNLINMNKGSQTHYQGMNYNNNNNQNNNNNNYYNIQESAHFGVSNNNNNQIFNQNLIQQEFAINCINLMGQYETNIDNYKFSPSNKNNKNENIKQALKNEKDNISEKFKRFQQDYQNKIGNPNINYNVKFEQYLNLVLEHKIKELEESINNSKNINYNMNNNNNNKNNNNNNNNINNNNNNNLSPNKKLKKIENNKTKNENENENLNTTKSKYNEIRKSVFNDDTSNNSELLGWSKLVVTASLNNNDKSSFLTTWKEDKKENDKNEIKYNVPEEDLLMPKKIEEENKDIDINDLTNKDNNTSIKPKLMERIEKMNNIKISENNQNISLNFDESLPKNITIQSNKNDNVNIFEEFEKNNFNKGNNNNIGSNYMNSIQNLNSISLMKSDNNGNNNIDEDILNDELDEDYCNYNSTNISNKKNITIKKDDDTLKKEDIEEEENYEKEFEKENDLSKIEKKSYDKINLNDYKEIHDSQQFQNQLNFFESNNNIGSSNIKKSKHESPKKNPNQLLVSESINDSYGDDIINNLNKFRNLALQESTINSKK